jgi:hypothetical protein
VDLNGARAAAVAGYRHPGVAAVNLLNPRLYPHVVAEVQRRLGEKRAACAAEARRLVAEVAKVAFADPRQLLDQRGAIRGLHELPDDAAAAVARMELICTDESATNTLTALSCLLRVPARPCASHNLLSLLYLSRRTSSIFAQIVS